MASAQKMQVYTLPLIHTLLYVVEALRGLQRMLYVGKALRGLGFVLFYPDVSFLRVVLLYPFFL